MASKLPRGSTAKPGSLASGLLVGATHASPLLLGLATFLLYLRTLGPDVFVSDFAEFQYLPALLGLPHPNGFPLYMLMGWAWSHLPMGNLAWRMNLLSAVGGGMTVTLTAAFARRLSGRTRVGLLAGALLAVTPTFWGYSLLAERYTLNLGLLVAALWTAWEATVTGGDRRRERLLVASSLMLGLGLTMHPSDALLIPFWFAYLLWRVPEMRRDWRIWFRMAVAGAAPLILFVYVPWRWAAYANVPLLPGVGRSEAVYRGLVHVWYEPPLRWDMVWYYITGLGGYAAGLVAGGWQEALAHLNDVWPYWRAEIPWPLAILSALGGLRLARREGRLALVLLAFGIYLTLMVAYIQQGKNDAYLLPAFWIVLFAAGFVVDWPVHTVRRQCLRSLTKGLLLVVAVVLPLALLVMRYSDRDLSRRVDIREWWETTLQVPVEEGAALLGHWSDFTPLWYLQQTEGLRSDIIALFPPDIEKVVEPWLATGRPLYLAAPTHGWAPELPKRYSLVPWGRLIRILPKGSQQPCPTREGAPRGSSPGLDVVVVRIPSRLEPEKAQTLQFCWRAKHALPHDLFASVRLVPVDGGPSLDLTGSLVVPWYPFNPIPAGTEGLALVPLRVPLGTRAGRYQAQLTFFTLPPGGAPAPLPDAPTLSLGEITIEPTTHFFRALLPKEMVPLVPPRVGPLRLRAWYLSDLPVRPGDPVRLDLVWEVAEVPPARLSLQVRFWGRGGRGLMTPPQPLLITAKDVGRVVRTTHDLRAPRGLGDHIYLVEPRVLAGGRRLPWFPTRRWLVGAIRVHDRPHLWAPPADLTPVSATWSDVAELVGYKMDTATFRPGQVLRLKLVWRGLGEANTSYKVFVHVVDEAGNIVAQHDSVPAQGTLPTDVWVTGEYIEDVHPIPLPAEMGEGTYDIRVGLYNPATGERVNVTSSLPTENRSLLLVSLNSEGR